MTRRDLELDALMLSIRAIDASPDDLRSWSRRNGVSASLVDQAVGALYPAAEAASVPDAIQAELDADPALLAEFDAIQRRRRARELDAEFEAQRNPLPPVDVATLEELLKRDDSTRWRIGDFWPAGGRLLVTGQRKAGKSGFVGNLSRSLLTAEPFLGRFPVEPIEGSIMLLNFEVTGATFARWLADMGFGKKTSRRLHVVNLRGRENLLATDDGRARLVAMMRERGVEVLAVDPFARAFGGEQNSNSEVAAWLGTLDRVAEEGGAAELVLVAHAGWGQHERARGASALEDWPDSIVTLTVDDDAPGAPRYLKAIGRDVDVEKDRLGFDPETRLLRMTGEGGPTKARQGSKARELFPAILQAIESVQGVSSSGLSEALRRREDVTFQKGDDSRAVGLLVDEGRVIRVRDSRVVRHYTPGNVPERFAPEPFQTPTETKEKHHE